MRLSPSAALLVPLVALVVGCSAGPGASPSPTGRPSVAPTAAPSGSTGRVVVTFLVAGEEEYRIELTDPADLDIARRLLAGEEAPGIPNGIVVRGDPGVNTGYSWHIDPDTLEFADMTVEVCDGRPSDVEANQITSDRYCPWDAKVIRIQE
ncbi:MAG: hypothetical protein FJ038_04655 [Chloroflexi bacterium]|nr:hypothetical protein [Chloroflexota bacterium]